jgi:hypothetical protein
MHGIKIQLPSRGHYGPPAIQIRRPKLGDLIDYFQAGDNSVVSKNSLIQGLCSEGVELGKLTTGDREFIFTNIRSLVNSNVITGTAGCTTPGCGETIPYVLDLSKCKVDQLPADFRKDYELTFPISGKKKVINILTVEREELLEDFVRFYESTDVPLQHSDLGPNLYEFARYGCMLHDSDSVAKLDENIAFLRELHWDDFELLLLYDISFETGPRVVAETQCDACKQKYRIRIKTDNSFFGLSLEGLINRHRFLAKASNIGFDDFLKYTVPLMHTVTEGEVERVKAHNAKVKAQNAKKRK